MRDYSDKWWLPLYIHFMVPLVKDYWKVLTMNIHDLILPEDKLYECVQKMTGINELKLGEWSCNQLGWNATNAVTGGLYRVTGDAWGKDKPLQWSLILKIVVPARNFDDPRHYNYWKREVLAYQSGVLENLPSMIKAPRCFAAEEQEDQTVWLWLEEVSNQVRSIWTQEDYLTAARILGTFNGSYLTGEPLPDEPWLCKRWLSSWIEECDKYDDGMALISDTWKNPLLSELFPANMFERYQEFHKRRLFLLDGLMNVPRVLTHNDAWPPNLFLQGKNNMVAIDWAFVGIAGVGEELGRLYGLILHMAVGSIIDAGSLFNHYMAGIRDAGWNGDSAIVRFGFTASAGIRCGMVVPKLVEQITKRKNEEGLTEEMKVWGSIAFQLLELAEEALSLHPK
jgi:hypothetical protein